MIMKKTLLAVLLVCFGIAVSAAESMWMTDFAAARKKAAESGKNMLVNFTGSDWCPWCIRLQKEVFSQKEFQDFAAKNLVLVIVDFPRRKWQTPAQKRANEELRKLYGVEGYPTVLLLTPKGMVKAELGYEPGGAAKYVEKLRKLMEK